MSRHKFLDVDSLATSGETSGLGYQGQVTDPSTGFTDMGTRYYSPDLGRFTTKDVLFGDPSDPLSLDQFIYAQDDPVTYIYPDGMRIEGGGGGLCQSINGCNEHDEKTASYYFSRLIPWHGQDLPTNDIALRIVALVTGFHDASRCVHGSIGGCIWTAIMFTPFGRVARGVKILHDIRDIEVAGRVIDDAAGVAGDARVGGAAAAIGYRSFSAFKRALGPAGDGMEWHHIVAQTPGNVARFGPEAIHNTDNVIRVSAAVHRRISGFYASIQDFTGGFRVRQWLSQQTFEQQRAFGIQTLRDFGVVP